MAPPAASRYSRPAVSTMVDPDARTATGGSGRRRAGRRRPAVPGAIGRSSGRAVGHRAGSLAIGAIVRTGRSGAVVRQNGRVVNETVAVPEALGFDNPEAYIPRDRRRALAHRRRDARPGPRRRAVRRHLGVHAADRGAGRRSSGRNAGAEELTAILGDVFHAVIEELDRFGGDVIYFSGDAITCWLDGDDGTRATACALAMQAAMARVGDGHDAAAAARDGWR